MRFMTPALLATLVVLNTGASHGAPNDCWPPLNGTSQIVEKPVPLVAMCLEQAPIRSL